MFRCCTNLFAILFFCGVSYAQIKTTTFSIEVQGETKEQLLNKIEASTGFKFYYLAEWLDNTPIYKSYGNNTIQSILEDILADTNLHFKEYGNGKVYLTQGRLIHDYLPDDFFPATKEVAIESSDANEASSISVVLDNQKATERQRRKTIRIGKQNVGATNSEFTISGYVKNELTGNPLPNVVVSTDKNKNTLTNSQGYYSLELPYGQNIVFTDALGLERLEQPVIVYSDGTLDISLKESVEQLDEVVISANSRQVIDGTTTGKNTIESEESKTIPVVLGERDLLKIATTLPGITTAGEGSAGFNVRGGKTDQNLILLDNSVLYNSSHFFGIFQALNPYTVKSIDIYKGNIPAEFGGRLSSVFNINTIDSNTEKISGEASIGPVTGNLKLEIPIIKEKAALMVAGRGTYSDWILGALDNEDLQGRSAFFYDLIAKYQHELNSKNNVEAMAYYSKDAFSITQDSLYAYENKLISMQWNHKLNEKHQGSLKLSRSDYFFEIDYDGRPQIDFNYNFNIKETQLKLKMRYAANTNHSFTYGISSKLYELSPGTIDGKSDLSQVEEFSLSEEKGLESAIFIADNIKVSEKLQLDLGLRYSIFNAIGPSEQRIYAENQPRNETSLLETQSFDSGDLFKTYSFPEVRVGARYYIKPDFSAKASYSSSTQYIHSLSNNTTVSPIDTWKLSDINIEPQRASLFSAGLYKFFGDNTYETSIEGFYKTQNNILDFKVGAQLLLNEVIEQETLQGKGKSYGVEFLLRKNRGALTGWLGYTYSRSFFQLRSDFPEEQVSNGEFFPANFDKPHDISLVSNYNITKRLSFSTNFTYQTGRPVTFPTGTFFFNGEQQVLYSQRNKFRIPDYYRLDIGFNLEGNHKKKKLAHSFWSFSIYNVLGRNNPYSVFFVTQDGEVKAFQSSVFNIPVPSLTYNLKF